MPLADFLIQEESIWPRHGGMAVEMASAVQGEMAALLAPDTICCCTLLVELDGEIPGRRDERAGAGGIEHGF